MRALIAALVCCCTCSNAFAEPTIAAGGLYGGPSQSVALCYVFNFGFATQPNVTMWDQNGHPVPLSFNNCNTLVAAGATCVALANIANNMTYSCGAAGTTYQGNIPNLRGVLELRDANGHPLMNTPLH